jgi:hypothetical protein
MSYKSRIKYGPVFVMDGEHKGRIGYYDSDDNSTERTKAIIYFGDYTVAEKYFFVPKRFLRSVTTHMLMNRCQVLNDVVSPFHENASGEKRIRALEELIYVEAVLADRMFKARFAASKNPVNVFISYSSRDRQLATRISIDLENAGHRVWLDEWRIRVGESIPRKIGQGLQECQLVAVLLSKHAVQSRWVENEWQAKYWEEIVDDKIRVLPILVEDCVVPVLLKTKKYADFRKYTYDEGLETLLWSIASLGSDRPRTTGLQPSASRRKKSFPSRKSSRARRMKH